MRTAGVVFSVVAVLAGIFVARLEYERDQTAESTDSSFGRPTATDVPPGVERQSRSPGVTGPTGASVTGLAGDDARGEGTRPDETSADAPIVRSPSEPLRKRHQLVESLIAIQQFQKAATMAGDLIGALEAEGVSPSDEIFVAVRRLAARANAFRLLVDNIERPETQRFVSQVFLANGNTIEVVRADRQGDRYVLELPNGISYRPRLDEVLEVREMSREQHRRFLLDEWEHLRRRLEKIEDPVELYVRGVERCYRSGLESEGLELLERLLAMPGSVKIPRRFAGAEAAAAARDWEVAAGRAPVRPRPTEPEASTRGSSRTGDNQRTRTASAPESPEESLTRVRSLRDEARKLYRRGFRGEGDGRALRQARQRLEEAFTLIESLVASEEVNSLRRELGQLLSDVVRVSPF